LQPSAATAAAAAATAITIMIIILHPSTQSLQATYQVKVSIKCSTVLTLN